MSIAGSNRNKIWDFEKWCLYRWRGDMIDRGFQGKTEYSLFHDCGPNDSSSSRVATSASDGGQKYCVRCLKNAPDGAVAVRELMNWET